MTRPSSFVWAFAVIAVAGLAPACLRRDARAAEVSEMIPAVAAAGVVRGDITEVLRVASEFRPFQEVDIHSKVAGYLRSVMVDVGDRVKAGQLLGVLEVPELQDDLKQGDAGIKRAYEEVNRAQADLDRAKSAHDVAHLSSTRLGSVIKARPNLIAQQDIDEAGGRDRVAEAQVATANAALASAREQLEIAKASQGRTQTLFNYARITAPFSGVITRRYADPGAMIQAGTSSQTQALPIVRLSQNDTLRLVIPVPESAAPRIRVGAPVDLSVQSLNKTFTGRVARFAERLDSDTRTMRVEVDVRNPSFELMPGMYANAAIVVNEARNVIVVPVQAVERGERAAQVFVVDRDNRVQMREVAVGLASADRIEITRGLETGDLVVVGNRALLKAGTTVAPKVDADVGQDRGR